MNKQGTNFGDKIQIGDSITLHHGDCADVLKTLPENSIDAIVTDPPAGISFMGKEWDHHKGGRGEWVAWSCANIALAIFRGTTMNFA